MSPGISLAVLLTGRPRARAILDQAHAALGGGAARIEAVESWDIEGQGRVNFTAEIQGLSPVEPTWRPLEERIGIDAKTLSVACHRPMPRNDMSVRFRRMIYKPDASGFVDFVAGFDRLRPAQVPEAQRRGFIRRVPHLLLIEAATKSVNVRLEGERELGDLVSVTLLEGVPGNRLRGCTDRSTLRPTP